MLHSGRTRFLKQQKPERAIMPSLYCLPLASADAESIHTESPSLVLHAKNRFPSVPKCLLPTRPARSPATSMHRCLLISEILSLVLEFIRQCDECPHEQTDLKWDRTVGKRSLASLARTCRTFSAPALDALWERLDSLDPLIKVLPRRMWAKKHHPLVVRMFMGEKQWSTFRKYAERVKFVRGPCWRVPASVQHNVISALARFPRASLPLLPNLTELVWSELKMSNLIDPSVSLIKYFAGPRVTSVSLYLICWPNHVSSELAVLADLPNLCPNVTSFTAFFPRSSYNDHSPEIGEIVSKWYSLRILRSCALSQPVMDQLTSRGLLETLNIELNNSNTAVYVAKLPNMVHTFSVGGNSAPLCMRYLQTVQGSPTSFRLRIGADDSTTSDIEDLFAVLPARIDNTVLHSLTIELTSSYWSTPASDTFLLTGPLLSSLFAFSRLRELDLNLFSSSELDDAEYGRMAGALRDLRSLKVGAADVSKARPVASIGAVIAVLKCCKNLESLHIAFDGSIPPPPPVPASDKGKQRGESPGGCEGEEEWMCVEEWRVELGWGISNRHITEINVGHSPIEEVVGLEDLASCLRSLMPRLEKIRSDRYPSGLLERWRKVQERMLVRG